MTIFWHSLKKQLSGARWYAVGLFIYSWMLLAVWPSMQRVNLDQYMAAYPKEFLQFFGGGEMLSLSTIEGFLSIEYLAIFFVLIIGFNLASNAGAALAGSIENRTMDFTLSQPISRRSLFWQELAATFVCTLALVWVGIGSIFIQSAMYDITISTKGFVLLGILATVFLWLWIGIAYLISSLTASKTVVAAGTLGLMIITYTITALSGMTEKLKTVSHWSPFQYYDPAVTIKDQALVNRELLILAGTGLLLAWLAGQVFNRRDI